MLRLIGMLCAMLAAGEATALSCVAPNFGRDFNEAAASEKSYDLAHGRLTPVGIIPPPPHPDPKHPANQRDRVVDFRFNGRFLGPDGPGPEREIWVRVRARCMGQWCSGFSGVNGEALMLLEARGLGAYLEIDPCGVPMLLSPEASDLGMIGRCLQQGACRSPELAYFGRGSW